MLKAQDIMTREVITVSPETGIQDLARRFVETRVSAMPVVDEGGRLQGIVTETDLVSQDKPLHIPTVISIFDWVLYLESPKAFEEEVEKITAQKVGEICTREVITCGPDTPVSEIAALMSEKKAHLIPVVDADDKVLGVVARLDVIKSVGA